AAPHGQSPLGVDLAGQAQSRTAGADTCAGCVWRKKRQRGRRDGRARGAMEKRRSVCAFLYLLSHFPTYWFPSLLYPRPPPRPRSCLCRPSLTVPPHLTPGHSHSSHPHSHSRRFLSPFSLPCLSLPSSRCFTILLPCFLSDTFALLLIPASESRFILV
ncbi:hypothetical protein B0H11DRAFT_2119417, partial [Mycena galericulata]